MTGAAGSLPRVLVLARAWSPAGTGARELADVRAVLRGNGGSLTVIGDGGAWTVYPDDEALEYRREAFDAVAPRLGVRDGSDAVFAIDGDGLVRYARVPGGDVHLAELVDAAACALRGRPSPHLAFSRRAWLAGFATLGATALLGGCGRGGDAPAASDGGAGSATGADAVSIVLAINGERHAIVVEPRATLLDTLRERLGLAGTKLGCNLGKCGACTVLVDGRRTLSCLTLAVMADGAKITTIEGLGRGDELHPVQQAFVDHDAFQCGFCTPGQIMNAVGLLAEGRAGDDASIREHCSGNLCRCGAYPNIVAAIRAARG